MSNSSQWQIAFTGQIVDRGIVPLVGMTFMLVGYWIDDTVSKAVKSSGFSIRLPVFILSLFLGFMFLILVPLHLNNLRLVSSNAMSQIEEKAGEAENRISEQYEQLNAIASDPQRLQLLESRIQELDTAIGSGQFQGQNLNAQQLQRLTETNFDDAEQFVLEGKRILEETGDIVELAKMICIQGHVTLAQNKSAAPCPASCKLMPKISLLN